ncbi:hypothetical protein [Oceanisphaera pacifica]|uniref:Uncharacterized protein n=1 Tax=Oceanisphaera pacifica TaxID=2818389 RepID=A0ABS3NCC2_9GAMM|nr:hypothetical protein [Oceanisphaera pacifica]MBO1518242.1 hypothetical protein [Oceanisphaera pacifica]
MKPFSEFCQRYELNPDTEDAREQYAEYQRQLELFRNAAGLGNPSEPPSHSFVCVLGEVTVCKQSGGRFTVSNQNMGFFVQCRRDNFSIECWPMSAELREPAGAQAVISSGDGLRLVLPDLCYEDAARLAWFTGVNLTIDKE